MTAATKEEILQAALNAVSQYPTLGQYVQAGDPRVLAQLGANAAMLAMLAEQVDVASTEPYIKARDGTVLADATLKGVLPLARACRADLSVTNGDTSPFNVAAGRRFLDSKGRIFTVDAAVTIAAGATVAVSCTQRTTRVVNHNVVNPIPYYQIEVPQTDDEVFMDTLEVWKGPSQFAYQPDWFNVGAGEYVYQVETDEFRRLYVCLGASDIVGYGAQAGDVIQLTIGECEGRITDLQPGAKFNLEYVYTIADGLLTAVLSSVTDEGAAPPSMSELRVMSRYPAIYDHNAVYLGEFDFLLRRYLSGIRFLSVWNEQIEESMRGANLANINRLRISGLVTGMTAAAFKTRVTELITRADDSYRLSFVPTVKKPVAMLITGKIGVVHEPADAEAQIRAAVLARYGDGSSDVSKGMSNPFRKKAIYEYLQPLVPAFQDELSDFDVAITIPSITNYSLYSEQIDNAAWTKLNLTITANASTNQDGSMVMDKLVETAVNANHHITQSFPAVLVNDVTVISCYAKKGERDKLVIASGGEAVAAVFDLTLGTIVTPATAGSTIEDVGNGVFRCSARFIKTNTNAAYYVRLHNGTTDTYLGVVATGLYVCGVMAEKSAELSGYLPTTTLAVTQTQILPEHFLYVSPTSLTVSITKADYNTGLWNH